jgi:hypothetical protein
LIELYANLTSTNANSASVNGSDFARWNDQQHNIIISWCSTIERKKLFRWNFCLTVSFIVFHLQTSPHSIWLWGVIRVT